VLGRERREELLPTITELATSESLPVKIEAAILLYQWGEKKTALPLLEQLSKDGVALRRAFLTGRKKGKNQYDKKGKKFLRRGLDAENVYTQLDAALGLYEMGEGKKALTVFTRVMETEETFYVRMAALNYLRHLKDDKQVRAIIEIAAKDRDERVQQRASQILAEPSRKK
jgi:HEAT repeat protein